ncbi:MAG TPA: hypothetical protein VI033_06500, partial [Candidatus Nitrosopolaris sp.]
FIIINSDQCLTITLTKYMRCSCGNREVISPKFGETMERYMARRLCRICNTRGNWREETVDETRLN